MALNRITDASTEPVTLAEAKLHLKVDGDDDDALISTLITAAREEAEHELGRALISQTWELTLDAFPDVEMDLGKANVLAITYVRYIDENGDEQTLDSDLYSLDDKGVPCWLLPAVDAEWPDTLDTTNAVTVRFTCGFGVSASAVPANVKAWMKVRIGSLYKQRESFVTGVSMTPLPEQFTSSLLDRYRVYGL